MIKSDAVGTLASNKRFCDYICHYIINTKNYKPLNQKRNMILENNNFSNNFKKVKESNNYCKNCQKKIILNTLKANLLKSTIYFFKKQKKDFT